MTANGAKILHLRCVEYARQEGIPVHVRFVLVPGLTDPEANVSGVASSLAANQLENNFYEASDTFGLPLPRRFTFTVRLGY